MHRTSDVPNVQRVCNTVWNQGWIARVPAHCLNHKIVLLNSKSTLGNRCSTKDTQEHSAPNHTLSAFSKVRSSPHYSFLLCYLLWLRTGQFRCLGRGHKAGASLAWPRYSNSTFLMSISLSQKCWTPSWKLCTQEMSNAGIISNTNNSLSFSTMHLYQYFNTTVTRKIAFFCVCLCLLPPLLSH